MSSVQLKQIDSPKEREQISQEIERHIGTNWRISHHLNPEKDAQIMSSVPIYVWQRQGRNRAGLLLLRAGLPAIYWNTEQDQPYALKLQVPATLTFNGSCILIATLSKAEKLLTFEDVWAYEGRSLLRDKKYSERWPILEKLFFDLNRQQYFLGADLQLVEPMSLDNFIAQCDERPEDGTVWEFQPDVPLRRRLVWMIPGSKGIRSDIPTLRRDEAAFKVAARLGGADDPVAAEILTSMELKRSNVSMPQHNARWKPTTQPQPRIHSTVIQQQRCARLCVDTKTTLPDSYNLFSNSDNPSGVGTELIGKICVPRLAQSHELRKLFADGKKEARVDVRWNTTFKKYEILRILPDDTPLSPATMFYECAGNMAAGNTTMG